MIEETDFETFLYICKNKYQLFVYDKINLINIYNEEIKINDETEPNNLSKFLDINVYKIEKMIKNFITNITIIIEDDKVLDVAISIKKKYEKNIDQKHLENSLLEVQDVFRQNHQDQIIMHMIIVNNDTKEKNFLLNNSDINNDYAILEIKFISISNKFTFYFEKLLEVYQIKIRRYMSGSYIRSCLSKDVTDLSTIANKLNNGLNKNEVQLISKSVENKGFFEKFFQLFS